MFPTIEAESVATRGLTCAAVKSNRGIRRWTRNERATGTLSTPDLDAPPCIEEDSEWFTRQPMHQHCPVHGSRQS